MTISKRAEDMLKKNIHVRRGEVSMPDDLVMVLPPTDVQVTLNKISFPVTTTILDPWYNKGKGKRMKMKKYINWLSSITSQASKISSHVFVWGFPEIVHKILNYIPDGFKLEAWLTWYYKNCPSVIRGWRSSQLACLHLAKYEARLYPEHFLNKEQKKKMEDGKLRYMPGPPSVIEAPLPVGYVLRNEQRGHPAQKTEEVFKKLVLMTTKEEDIVLDPMCGSGTTGAVCRKLRRRAILCDHDEYWIEVSKERVGVKETCSFENLETMVNSYE